MKIVIITRARCLLQRTSETLSKKKDMKVPPLGGRVKHLISQRLSGNHMEQINMTIKRKMTLLYTANLITTRVNQVDNSLKETIKDKEKINMTKKDSMEVERGTFLKSKMRELTFMEDKTE